MTDLLRRRPISEQRVFFHSLWFRGHNNPRYTQLLPRLARLDPYLVPVADQRVLRALQFRLLGLTTDVRSRLVFAAANRKYRWMFAVDPGQTEYFRGRVVVDVDDPKFDEREVRALNRANLAAFVVTTEPAGKRFESLGVDKPWHVIPQGFESSSISEEDVMTVARRYRGRGEIVVGYISSWLLMEGDRDGRNPLFNLDHLFSLWDEISDRLPIARLWLIGRASSRVRRACAARPDVVLHGSMSQEQALSYIANFDIALYPRRVDHSPMPVKLAEYMGLGIPTVSYDLELAKPLEDAGAGLLARTPRDFVEAVERLARDDQQRQRMGREAAAAGAALDWTRLAERYRIEVFDRYLC
jgi:glycosyltransferase involved in cell wall biosynthesis